LLFRFPEIFFQNFSLKKLFRDLNPDQNSVFSVFIVKISAGTYAPPAAYFGTTTGDCPIGRVTVGVGYLYNIIITK